MIHLHQTGAGIKIRVSREIGLFQSQPFTNSHFHFLVIVEYAKKGHVRQFAQELYWK